jgi:DNA-binding Lrp family transcriptional regulator
VDDGKCKIDWDFAEIEYAKGLRSNCDIANQIGVSETAVRKRAKQYGWVKDLSAKIKLKADAKVRAIVFESHGSSSISKATERDIVDSMAELQAAVLLNERKEINNLSELSEKFELELKEYSEDLEKKFRTLKYNVDVREKIFNMRRRNYNINDNSLGAANQSDTHIDDKSLAATISGMLSLVQARAQK